MTWQKGQSGNPSGRRKIDPKLKEAAQKYTMAALATLAAIMKDKKAQPSARVTAAQAILDRGHGKPTQPIEGDLAVTSIIDVINAIPENDGARKGNGADTEMEAPPSAIRH